MAPGAALSILATAALTAIGGDFDQYDVGSDHRPTKLPEDIEPPLVILLHGHKFNAAMWGRYAVSFALRGLPTLAINFERHGLLLHTAAHDEGVAELAAVVAREIEGKLLRPAPRRRARSPRRTSERASARRGTDGGGRSMVLVGHSLGGLVASHLASDREVSATTWRRLGVEVRGVIGISTPYDGVHLLSWIPPLVSALPMHWQPQVRNAIERSMPRLVRDMMPHSSVCAGIQDAMRRHAVSSRCTYRGISGGCDPVVIPASASAPCRDDGEFFQSVVLLNEGHFTITMSDRLISTVVSWAAEMLES